MSEQSRQVLDGEGLTVLGSSKLTKVVGGGFSVRTSGRRDAGHIIDIGSDSLGVQARVTVEQKQPNFSPDPRTIFIAQAIGSEITVQEVVRPPVTEFGQITNLALGYAEAAIAANAIVSRVQSGLVTAE